MPVLITLRGLSETTHPRTVGEFIWHEASGRHLLRGQPFTAEQFNDFAASREWDRMIEREGARLQIRVVSFEIQGASEAAEAHNLGEAGSTPAPGTILEKARAAKPPAKKRARARK
jgi:hypothetical protein